MGTGFAASCAGNVLLCPGHHRKDVLWEDPRILCGRWCQELIGTPGALGLYRAGCAAAPADVLLQKLLDPRNSWVLCSRTLSSEVMEEHHGDLPSVPALGRGVWGLTSTVLSQLSGALIVPSDKFKRGHRAGF